MRRSKAIVLAGWLAALAAAGPAFAAAPPEIPTMKMERKQVGMAGRRSTGSTRALSWSAGGGPVGAVVGFVRRLLSGFQKVRYYPGTIVDLQAQTSVRPGEAVLTWTAPGAEGSTGTCSGYAIAYSATPLASETDFDAAGVYPQLIAPLLPGSTETHTLTDLPPGATLYFAVKGVEASGSRGYLSDVPFAFVKAPASIAGSLSYSGSQGGSIVVGTFDSTQIFTTSNLLASVSTPLAGAYLLADVVPNTSFYTAAFVDVNQNLRADAGEDYGFYGGATPLQLILDSGQSLAGVNLTIVLSSAASLGTIAGTVTYPNPTQSGPLRIELWADPSFAGSPIAAKSLAGPGAYSFLVPGDIGYFLRAFVDVDADAEVDAGEPSGVYTKGGTAAEQVFVPKQATVSGVNFSVYDPGCSALGCAGQGIGVLSTATAAAGTLTTFTVKLFAGAAGIQTGGRVGLGLPVGWGVVQSTCPACPGYATVSVVSGGADTIQLDGDPTTTSIEPLTGQAFALARLTAGSLAAGDTVQFAITDLSAPCATGRSTFTLTSAQNLAVTRLPLFAGSPALDVQPGAAVTLAFSPVFVAVSQFTPSQALSLIARDACGGRAGVAGAESVAVSGRTYNFATGAFDPDATLVVSPSTSAAFATPSTISFAAGQSSAAVYAQANSTGSKALQADYDFTGTPRFAYASLAVLPGNPLSLVSVSSGAFATNRSSVTITPDGDGSADSAFINFNLADPALTWTVRIASVPFAAGGAAVWQAFGSGSSPPGRLAWDGRFNLGPETGRAAPTGTYYVRITAGLVSNDSLRVGVFVNQVAGQVTDPSVSPAVPVPGVKVQAFGRVGALTTTDALGRYLISGLSTGTYTFSFSRAQYLSTSPVVAISTPSTTLDVLMNRAPILRVVPALQAGAAQAFDQYGELNVESLDRSRSFFSAIRLPAGTTTFDDGGQWDPSLQLFVTRTRIPFELLIDSYTVRGSLPGYVPVSSSVYVGLEGLDLPLPAFLRRANVSGRVSLSTATNPSPNPTGLSVSVLALRVSTTALAAGGVGGFALAFLPPGATSGTFTMAGVDPGSYTLRGTAPGFEPVSRALTVLGADIANADLSAFTEGGVLAGTITVRGNIAGFDPLDGSTFPISVDITAWSPTSAIQSRTRVFISTDAFSATPGFSPYTVTGLKAGTTYQVFAEIAVKGDASFESPGGFPKTAFISAVTQTGTLNFSLEKTSGAVAALLRLPDPAVELGAPAPDFTRVSLRARILQSNDPLRVGRIFEVRTSTALPDFYCADTNRPTGTAPGCAAGISSATFNLAGLRTETLEITMSYALTGRLRTITARVVNGFSTSVTMDLRGDTFSVSGRILNQISDPTFNTNAAIVQNAPFDAPAGFPPGQSSTTARVEAIRRDFGDLLAQVSTSVFDGARTRVGFLTSAGTFSVTGLQSGVYLVRTLPLRSSATGPVLVPSRETVVSISTFSRTGVDFTLSDGFSVTGTVSLDQGLQDARTLALTVRNRRGEVVDRQVVLLGSPGAGVNAGSVDFRFERIPSAGFYSLEVQDLDRPVRYIGRPLPFPDPGTSAGGLQGDLTGVDLALKRAAAVTGKMQDANSGALITEANATLLAPNFRIFALANPWVEGGFVLARSSVAGRPVEADGTFRLEPLLPGAAYDIRLEQDSWDLAFLNTGSQNYAPIVVAGTALTAGQVKDLGVLSLNQGQSVSGIVMDAAGVRLSNIPLRAVPAFVENPIAVNTVTGPDGTYTMWVSSFVSRYFDVTAAARESALEAEGTGLFAEKTLRLDLAKSVVADFILEPLLGKLTGQVLTADGGALSYPFGDQKGFPAAAVHLQRQGTIPQLNPLGDIAAITAPDGSFEVPGLSSATYVLKAASLGYSLFTTTVAVGNGTASAGTMTLARGASASGSLRKADPGSPTGFTCPNDAEVATVVAADPDFSDFLVGTVEKDPLTRSVCSYEISGFRTGVDYQLALLPPSGDDIVFPPEGSLTFSLEESTAARTVPLTFRTAGADCFATFKNLGNDQIQLKFRCNKSLRNDTALDNDLDFILQKTTYTSTGAPLASPDASGQLLGSDKRLLDGRRNLTAVYRLAAGETKFAVRLTAFAAAVNPATGENYRFDRVFDVFAGLQASKSRRMNNIQGGNLDMESGADETENSSVGLSPGSFVAEGSTDPAPGLSTEVGIKKGKTKDQVEVKLAARGLRLTEAQARRYSDPAAFPPLMASAIQALQEKRLEGYEAQAAGKSSTVTPFSAFYDLFLPAGIKRELKKKSRLKLTYDVALASTTPPTNFNLWYFNPATGRYELEDDAKEIDTTNQTVSALVEHFSVFVVLASTPLFSSTSPFTGDDLSVFNFPNPFNLEPKTKSLNVNAGGGQFAGGTAKITTRGTVLRVGVPRAVAGDGRIRIYNMAGELVRQYDTGNLDGNAGLTGAGTFFYFDWDGRNQSGKDVASGVYIGELKVGERKRFWKMAVVKDAAYQ